MPEPSGFESTLRDSPKDGYTGTTEQLFVRMCTDIGQWHYLYSSGNTETVASAPHCRRIVNLSEGICAIGTEEDGACSGGCSG